METYLIIARSFSFIIGICNVFKIGMLIRIRQHKRLFPDATLKDIESFEKNTLRNTNLFMRSTLGDKNSFN